MAERGVNVSNHAHAFLASVERLKSQEMNRAIAIALNRTAVGVRSAAIDEIRKIYKVKHATLTKAFTVRRAYHGKLQSMVFASGRPLNVIGFGARQVRAGVSVDIKGARKVIPGAFIMSIRPPGADAPVRAVFERKFIGARGGKRHGRFPIRGVTTVKVPGMFSKDVVVDALRGVAVDRFTRELASAVRAIKMGA